jgi:hypothetical protein
MHRLLAKTVGVFVGLLLVTEGQGQDALVPYPRVPGDSASADFTVRVNGTDVETVGTDLQVGYAHFAFSGTVRVEITARESIETFDLSPHRYGIDAQADGRTLSFTLTQPRKLHLRINALPRFFVFADGPEPDPPRPGQPGVTDLVSRGVASSPEVVQTTALQQAIDEVAAKRGVLYVPPGIYRCGQLRLKSGLTLYLAPGAILKGTGRIADYPVGELGTQQLDLTDCRDVKILGRGVIDGQGRALRLATQNASAGRSKLIRTLRSANCVVEDVVLRDSGTWGVHLVESSDLRFTNFKLISNTIHDDPEFPWESNTDGFDPDNSSRVLIEDGFISCNDDAIAVKLWYGRRRDMEGIMFRRNVVWTVKSALKVGTEVAERRLSNVAFEGNDVVHADRGIAVYCYRGGTIEDVRWSNNHFEFIGGDIKRINLEIKIVDEQGAGRLGSLLIRDNVFEREAENRSKLQGLDAEHPITGVTFDNLMIAGRSCGDAAAAQLDPPKHVQGLVFR